MSTQNIYFHGKIRKLSLWLKKVPYLEELLGIFISHMYGNVLKCMSISLKNQFQFVNVDITMEIILKILTDNVYRALLQHSCIYRFP